MNLDDCLNEKTKQIFQNLVANGYNIELEIRPDLLKSENNWWGMIPTYKIIAPNDDINKAAFTHELLHIHLFSKGFKDADIIYGIDDLGKFFNLHFLTRMNNDIAHLKMVKTFLSAGFNINQFLNESGEDHLLKVRKEIKFLKNNDQLMEDFINIFSMVRLLKNFYGLNTNSVEQSLKKIHKRLFELSNNLFDWWETLSNADNLIFYLELRKRLEELNNS